MPWAFMAQLHVSACSNPVLARCAAVAVPSRAVISWAWAWRRVIGAESRSRGSSWVACRGRSGRGVPGLATLRDQVRLSPPVGVIHRRRRRCGCRHPPAKLPACDAYRYISNQVVAIGYGQDNYANHVSRSEALVDTEDPVDLALRIQTWLATGEDYHTEFKSDRKHLADNDLVEAVVCLANGAGGVVLVGVEDDG